MHKNIKFSMRIWFVLVFLFACSCLLSAADNPTDFNRYLERAKKKIGEGNYTEAVEALQKASIKSPEDPEIYFLLGDCHKKLKNYANSAKNYAYAKALSGRKENILLEGAIRLVKLF